MKRILSCLLILAMLIACIPAVVAQETQEPTVILLGSDYQNNCYQPSYNRYYYDNTPIDEQPRTISLQAILDAIAADGISPDAAMFVGDYTDHFQDDGNAAHCAGDGIKQIRSMLTAAFGELEETVFSQGNHDYEGVPELAESGLQAYDDDSVYLTYVINEKDFPYRQSTSDQNTIASTAQRLGECMDQLAEEGETRPIFVLCHVPLHYSTRYSGGDNPYANLIFDELNEPAADLNVFFFFGHNHSGAAADYEADWGGAVNYVGRGQILDVNKPNHGSTSNEQTLNFTYMNAGYVGYSTSATNDSRTMSVLTVYENRVAISRYDANGEYTAAESLGQTNPLKPEEGAVANYPLTVILNSNSPYTVSAESANPLYGSVAVKNGCVTATAEQNYGISDWVLTPADAATVTRDGDNFYFSDLTADCTLTVYFEEVVCASEPFTDVDQSLWYHDGIDYAVTHGMFNGVSDDRFAPNSTMTRAMLVTVLYRLEGSPVIIPTTDFDDVPENVWYSEAVAWAALLGIVDGVTPERFAPMQNVTREQAATILCRYAAYKDYNTGDTADLSTFADAETVSSYAQKAMAWAVATGLMDGVGNHMLNPRGSATRAQVAVILMRFCETIAK